MKDSERNTLCGFFPVKDEPSFCCGDNASIGPKWACVCVYARVFLGRVDTCVRGESSAPSLGLPCDLCHLWERGRLLRQASSTSCGAVAPSLAQGRGHSPKEKRLLLGGVIIMINEVNGKITLQ